MNLDLKALSEQGNLHSKYTLSIEKFCLSILECMCRRIYRQLMAWLGTCMFVNACAEFLTAATKTWKNEEESFLDPETIQKGKPKEKWGINNQSLKMTLCLSYQQGWDSCPISMACDVSLKVFVHYKLGWWKGTCFLCSP